MRKIALSSLSSALSAFLLNTQALAEWPHWNAATEAGHYRICTQMGAAAHSAPTPETRLPTDDPHAHVKGGSLVRYLGATENGFIHVLLPDRTDVWLPEREAGTETPTQCESPHQIKRLCQAAMLLPQPATQESPEPLSAGTTLVQWQHFTDDGGFAYVEDPVTGQFGFVSSGLICPSQEAAPSEESKATRHFQMLVTGAHPNGYQHNRKRERGEIRRIVIHNTEGNRESAVNWFLNEKARVAAHVILDRDGQFYRAVEDDYVAYHAGARETAYNVNTLGIEVVAQEGEEGMTPVQEQKLIELVRFWMDEYGIRIPDDILKNTGTDPGYNNLEFARAPVTIHRLIKPARETNCPKLIWDDTAAGDEAFFRWRETNLGEAERLVQD